MKVDRDLMKAARALHALLKLIYNKPMLLRS